MEAGDDELNGRLEIQSLDADEAPTIVRGPSIRVAAGERYRTQALFKPGRPQAPLTIRVVNDDGDLLCDRTFADVAIPKAFLATQTLMLELGGRIGLEALEKQYEPDHPERVVAIASEIAALPKEAIGFESVEVVVVATSDAKTHGEWSAERVAALDGWVRGGGTLILCVGGNGESVLASDSPLARFAPGEFDSVVNRGPGAWESFAGALSEPMTTRGGARIQPIRTTVLKNVRGEIDHSDGNIPLVVRAPRGFGTVIFAAADLDQPPFSEWSARGKLLLRLLERQDPQAEATAARESASLSTRWGYTDLSGQLRSALDRFEGVKVVSFFLVALLGLAFLLLLFPLEYLLVRSGGRFALTWITFPLLLVGAGAGAWWFANRSKGDEVRVNRVDIVDTDLASGGVRGNTFFGLFSPATAKYDLSVQASKPLSESNSTRLSWLGLPGPGLGGMNSTVINPTSFEQPYRFGGNRLDDLPLAQWSSKSFHATWGAVGDELLNSSTSDQSPNSAGSFLGERSADRQPLGTIQNRTAIDLSDCVLFYAGWAYPLGNLPAQPDGEKPSSANLSRPTRSLTIHAFLTDRRIIGEKEQSTPYDPASDDLTQIMRMLMFYDSAGGRRYTGLSDRYFDSLDITPSLRLGRAVLLARGPAATKLSIQSSGADHELSEQSLAFYRFVIPVSRGLSSDEADQATAELVFPHAGSNADVSR
jgi:hypothetical protein